MREYLWVSYSHLFLINQQPALWPSGVEYEKGFTEGADMEPPRKFTLSRVDSANIDRPIWGTVVCAGLGDLLVLYLQIPSPLTGDFGSIAIGAGAAGFLGWVGWTWAKHVYF